MSTETEYNLKEAAARLGWSVTTLRDKCTANAVAHHRRHAVRGIFFTDDDITLIQAREPRRPGLAPRAGALPSPGWQNLTAEDAEIDAALAALAGPTRVAVAG